MMMHEKVSDFLSHVALPGKKYSGDSVFKLGKSFENGHHARELCQMVAKRFSAPDNYKFDKVEIKKLLLKGKLLSDSLDSDIKFRFFILLINNYFSSISYSFYSDADFVIKLLAKALGIDKKDFLNIMDFYHNNCPYLDNKDALYIANKNESKLVSIKGINVHFSQDNEEVIYLKYFRGFDLFLSKTIFNSWSKASFEKTYHVTEINLVSENDFSEEKLGFKSFNELKKCVFTFIPFQKVEIDQTETSPHILLDPISCEVRIMGNSRPISDSSYFEPVSEWLMMYGKYGKSPLNIHLQFGYINTYTMRFLLKMIRILNHYVSDKRKINIVWVYELHDDDQKEFGEQLRDLFSKKNNFLIQSENQFASL
jgi:hypothetical protein